MMTYGLIGFPLEHSFSEKYFSEKFLRENIQDAQYKLFPLNDIRDFVTLIKSNETSGLNVTIPYKQSIINFIDEVDGEAIKVGAVNTIKFIKKNDKIITKGYNTDIFGFERLLFKNHLPENIKALILGTGGSSKAVAYVLKKKNILFSMVSRKPSDCNMISYKNLTSKNIEEHKLIINTTPLGMYPDIVSMPDIPYESISSGHICIDLVYNPEKSSFLKCCEQHQSLIVNGMEMLISQAEKSWEIWNH